MTTNLTDPEAMRAWVAENYSDESKRLVTEGAEPTPEDRVKWQQALAAEERDRFMAATSPCVFRIHNGERPLVDQLHSHAASLAYDLYDPSADPAYTTPEDLMRSGLHVLELAQRVMQDTVDRAREAGRSWHQIGVSLGVSRQAAQQRFGKGEK
jgi:hypothetical protein